MCATWLRSGLTSTIAVGGAVAAGDEDDDSTSRVMAGGCVIGACNPGREAGGHGVVGSGDTVAAPRAMRAPKALMLGLRNP